jgi:hypothetical protein
MARASLSVNISNQGQGELAGVERFAVFIGVATENVGIYQRVNQKTDFDAWLGAADSDLKSQVMAAAANAGQDWAAGVVAVADGAGVDGAIDIAMAATNAEFIGVCVPQTTKAELDALHAKAMNIFNSLARPVIIAAATPGIDAGSQSWADYTTAQQTITADVSAYRVAAVPQLHGNNLGVVLGRACHSGVSIADSIMRTATGAAIGLGAVPVDNAGTELSEATLATLESYRLTVTQTYPDFAGTYFSDFNLLDTEIGDYKVAENLRVVDKAIRQVRAKLLPKIANRNLNDTPLSMEWHRNYLRGPLVLMSQKTNLGGQEIPGDIRPPNDESVELVWTSTTAISVYVTVQPFNAPKQITASVGIDFPTSA